MKLFRNENIQWVKRFYAASFGSVKYCCGPSLLYPGTCIYEAVHWRWLGLFLGAFSQGYKDTFVPDSHQQSWSSAE
eukprot:1230866-Rhodomonas_salina.1